MRIDYEKYGDYYVPKLGFRKRNINMKHYH